MQPNVQTASDALDMLPPRERLALLVMAVVDDEDHASTSVGCLISIAAYMGLHLPPAKRLALAIHMRNEAQTLDDATICWN
jgi:hypothetical protein